MRIIIPQDISDLGDMVAPYLKYTEGEGMTLSPDAPEEVVEALKKLKQWHNEHHER